MCLNKLCKTPQSRVQEHSSYCDKCTYLSKNQPWFPNSVQPRNTCGISYCTEPITAEEEVCSPCERYYGMVSDPNFCETCMDDIQFCPHYEG